MSSDNVLWWSHGGTLKGESPERFRFLYQILADTPGLGLMPIQRDWDAVIAVPDTLQSLVSPEYYLIYYGFMRPSFREF